MTDPQSSAAIAALRESTGLPFLTILNALEACGWDEEKAYRLLVTNLTTREDHEARRSRS
jgi:translation elongation factor EF-Ts